MTAFFDDKATFIDTSKTPIFEWEVAILFIHLWVDKVVLVSMTYKIVEEYHFLTLQFVVNLRTQG